jgi:DUF4097 and DUF4098 domain-containing protein YvlB
VSAFGEPSRQPSLEIAGGDSNILVRAADVRAPVVVRGKAKIDPSGVVHVLGDHEVEIDCAPGTDVRIASKSGRVTLRGLLGRVFAASRSGDVSIENAESVDVRTASARVEVGCCAGSCEVVGHSGRITIGSAGTAIVSTASGDASIDSAVDATVRSASGGVKIGVQPDGTIDVCTLSGSVKVALAEGSNPVATLHSKSGQVRHREPPAGHTAGGLTVRTMSGSITVE